MLSLFRRKQFIILKQKNKNYRNNKNKELFFFINIKKQCAKNNQSNEQTVK